MIYRKGREGRKGIFPEIPSGAREPYQSREYTGMAIVSSEWLAVLKEIGIPRPQKARVRDFRKTAQRICAQIQTNE